jgi:hypothetical protein
MQARKAFPIEHGDRGSERRTREREVAILYKKLVRERDGDGSDVGLGTQSSAEENSADELGFRPTRHLAEAFAWKCATTKFISCDEFKGAREGHCWLLGPGTLRRIKEEQERSHYGRGNGFRRGKPSFYILVCDE